MAKKTKKKPVKQKPISIKNYIIEAARKLPIYKCLNMRGDESGIKQIVVARRKNNGQIIVGFYLIDLYCLGLKNTFFSQFEDSDQFDEKMQNMADAGKIFDEIEPNLAFNYIYGAIEYAEDIEFKPHKDFAITEYILDDVEKIEYVDIEFGYNGKPLFFAGPNDKTGVILAHLDKHVGKGNYDFVIGFDENDEDYDQDEEDDKDDEENEDDNDGLMEYYEELAKYEEMEPKEFDKVTTSIINRLPLSQKVEYVFIMSFAMAAVDLYDEIKLIQEYRKNKSKVFKNILNFVKKNLTDIKNYGIIDVEHLLSIAIENVIKFNGYEFVCLKGFVEALSMLEETQSEFLNEKNQKIKYFIDFMLLFEDKYTLNLLALIDDVTSVIFEGESFFELNIFNKNIIANKALKLIEIVENENELDQEWEFLEIRIEKHMELTSYLPEISENELIKRIVNLKKPNME